MSERDLLRHVTKAALVVAGAVMTTETARAQTLLEPRMTRPASQEIATTRHFSFHSDFWFNLHDHLVWVNELQLDADSLVSSCNTERRASEGWRAALAIYRDSVASRSFFDRNVFRIRMALGGDPIAPDNLPIWVSETLSRAAPLYEQCWWAADHAMNLAWADEVVPLVQRYEETVVPRLEELYQTRWPPQVIRIDLVKHVSRQGANSVVNPHHIQISVERSVNQGNGGLETVFHEGSHTMTGPQAGPMMGRVNAMAESMGITPPRDLWHVLLFVTTGTAIKEALGADRGLTYEPYIYSTGLFDRAWPELQAPVDRHWVDYLGGRAPFDDVVRRLLEEFR